MMVIGAAVVLVVGGIFLSALWIDERIYRREREAYVLRRYHGRGE